MRTVGTRERLVRVLESSAPLGIYEDEIVQEQDPTVTVANVHLELPIREYPLVPDIEGRYDALRAELDSIKAAGGDDASISEATGATKRAHMLLDYAKWYEGQQTIDVELYGTRIGDVAFVAMAAEPFGEIGSQVKARSPFQHTLFGGYTNGYLGYVPTDDAFPLGGYEVELATPFRPGAAGAIVEAAVNLLNQLAAGAPAVASKLGG
jgi:hypothetical protein